ncbi:oxidoreductase-like protein [Polychaeton citri CBS 116435]|uniref:Oxidoreductase-like protein n=1 Tax=Polychaeton citri CBS 116435 TaxID=1314669 RepID=A0A9P4Q0N2_9PEZI|nr:oxidoreductase-like protein [Polychaeton citri CBS 116435]
MAFYQDMPWHDGEREMRSAMRAPETDNPTVPALSPQLANHMQIAPLLAVGTLDADNRPWTTLWGGDSNFARPLGGGIVGIRTVVTGQHDPVVENLVGKDPTGEVVRGSGRGRMVSGLTIDLETRKRVKLFGRMIAGALGTREDDEQRAGDDGSSSAEIQLVLKIEQSLGNCPKYLNKKHIVPAASRPSLLSASPQLPQRAADLLANTDLFFISSSNHTYDMDTNHRGGPAGFVRVVSNDKSGAVICYPEYSGNRLYQTLGNLKVNPLAGICVPDFDNGDMLFLTGRTEVLVGAEAARLLPRSNLVVKMTVSAARLVASALAFRGLRGDTSPYNPTVRFLTSEKRTAREQDRELVQATLLRQTKLTPTISRFTFALQNAATYKAGQYVTLDFSSHLDIGYSHMRDDDPRSLNDDFVRTFTVSSPPGIPPRPNKRLKDDEFEITIRKVGVVTDFLFGYTGKEGAKDNRWGKGELEVGVKGFGGEFEVTQQDDREGCSTCFIAAGVGITPILPSLHELDMNRLKLLWTIRAADAGMVLDTLVQNPRLKHCLFLYITQAGQEHEKAIEELRQHGAAVHLRRIMQADVQLESASRYYICTGTAMRKELLLWLKDKEVIFEDFNF